MNQAGLASSIEVTGGDGAFVHIDQDNGSFQWTSYVYNQYRRSTNNGANWSSVNYSSSSGRFINPTDYDDTGNIMYCAGSANQYLVWTNPQSGSTFSAKSVTLNGGTVSAIKVSPYSSNTIFLGSSGGGTYLYKVTNANTTPSFTSIRTGLPNAYLSSIETGTSEQNLILSFSSYGVQNVWVSSNGGSSWTSIDGNLPDMPVRWAMFYPGNNTKAIIATETGVWQTSLINGSSTVWEPETSFPNVRTDMLQYRASDGLLAAATHGRGMFTAFVAPPPSCGPVTGLAASNVTFTSATLNWTALTNALTYDAEYRVAGNTTWLSAGTGLTTNNVALSNLTQGTTYEYRVRANCQDLTSAYAQAQFTTLAPCNAPGGLNTTNITSNSATLSWTAVSGASSYRLEYKLTSSSTWTVANSALTTTSFNLTGLAQNSSYDWQVRSTCSSGTSPYTQSNFTTLTGPLCPGTLDNSTNNTASGAATIPFNTDVYGLINPSGDRDFYKFVITNPGSATITLTNLPSNYDLYLFSSNGTTQLASSVKNNLNNESISRTYTAGTYYAQVRGRNSSNFNATNCYILKVQLGTASGQEIATEENAEEGTGTKISVFPNPSSDKLNIYMIGQPQNQTIRIFDMKGVAIYSQEVREMLTTLDISQMAQGVYTIIVEDKILGNQQSFRFVKD